MESQKQGCLLNTPRTHSPRPEMGSKASSVITAKENTIAWKNHKLSFIPATSQLGQHEPFPRPHLPLLLPLPLSVEDMSVDTVAHPSQSIQSSDMSPAFQQSSAFEYSKSSTATTDSLDGSAQSSHALTTSKVVKMGEDDGQSSTTSLESWRSLDSLDSLDSSAQPNLPNLPFFISTPVEVNQDVAQSLNKQHGDVKRKTLSKKHKIKLESFFQINKNPTVDEMVSIANDMNVDSIPVRVFYQNSLHSERPPCGKKRGATLPSLDNQPPKKLYLKTHSFTEKEKVALSAMYEKHNSFPPLEDSLDFAIRFDVSVNSVISWCGNKRRQDRGLAGQPTASSVSANPSCFARCLSRHTNEQIMELKKSFKQSPFPSMTKIMAIADSTGLTPDQVSSWNLRRRAKFNKNIANKGACPASPHVPITPSPAQPGLKKKYVLAPQQENALLRLYKENKGRCPLLPERKVIAKDLNILDARIKSWWGNRTKKEATAQKKLASIPSTATKGGDRPENQ